MKKEDLIAKVKEYPIMERTQFIGQEKLANLQNSINFLSEYMPDKFANHIVNVDHTDTILLRKTQLLYQLGEVNKLRSQLIQELTAI